MNIIEKSSENFNPINRDIAIVFTIGFVVAMAVVTMGIVVVSQL